MNRRTFMRSLGAAVAASMLPFLKPVIPESNERWVYRCDGIKAMLGECEQYYSLEGNALNLLEFMNENYRIVQARQKSFTECFFFNKPIPVDDIA